MRFCKSRYSQTILILLTIAVLLSGCYKPKSHFLQAGGSYILALRTQGATATSDYLLTQDTINNAAKVVSSTGNGIEQLAWCYFGAAGKTVFSFSYGTNNVGIGYGINEGGALYEKGRISFERMDCFGKGDDSTLIAIGAPWGGGSYDCQIQLIDANDIRIRKKRLTPLYMWSPLDVLNKWPTSIVVNDNKMYVSFYPLDGGTWNTEYTDTAYVTIFSYPGLDSLTTIKDSRTGPIGLYGNQIGMMKAENGDIYTVSPSSFAAGYTQVTKKSGILRIKNGQQSFDPSYFFDVETASGGAKLLTAAYAGDGLLVARLQLPGTDDINAVWGAFEVTNPICKMAIIDLNNKTVTDIADIPVHGGQYGAQWLVEEGKVYASITSTPAGEARIYAIDPLTATATRAAKIEGLEVPAIYKIK
ncbi:DUF4374 domain-containing protein [Niastella yeongjuensis]|uniref:DUF4374 domain-containing protein n=1 Tax=Niastella yeongjuensis TaxID=354355 RepID=UPI0008C14CA4|nr:DUF4374 domain-containing protein [Niastella yeongjuensis]SEO99772.1 protein of unknown function [Niastella yeongjuensis]